MHGVVRWVFLILEYVCDVLDLLFRVDFFFFFLQMRLLLNMKRASILSFETIFRTAAVPHVLFVCMRILQASSTFRFHRILQVLGLFAMLCLASSAALGGVLAACPCEKTNGIHLL